MILKMSLRAKVNVIFPFIPNASLKRFYFALRQRSVKTKSLERARMRLIFVSLMIAFCAATASQAASSRLGVIAFGADVQNAAALLTAALSKQDGIELLERTDLDLLAKERALSITKALEAARTLGADSLLFLESSGTGTNQLCSIRLVAAKPGVILFSTRLPWPPENVSEWAEKISVKIAPTAIKASVPAEKAVRLSILNLRSAANSPAQQILERELTSLLLVRLTQEPELFVLERRQLAAASFEQDLAAGEAKFWTGSHLLDGTINRDGYDPKRVTIAARLGSPDGTESLIEVEGPRQDLGQVIENLVTKILAALKVQKQAHWDAAREASQHLAEAQWALRWKMWPEAQAAADSAWALGEKTLDCATTRLSAYAGDVRLDPGHWRRDDERGIQSPYEPPRPEAVETPTQAMALAQETLANNPGAVTNKAWWRAARTALNNSGEVLAHFFWQPEARPLVESKLADLRALCRSVAETIIQIPVVHRYFWFPTDGSAPSQDEISSFGSAPFDRDFYTIYTAWAPVFYETPEETAAVYRNLLTGDAFAHVRGEFFDGWSKSPRLGGWKWADRQRERSVWERLVNEAAASTNLVTQFHGRVLKATLMPPDNNGYVRGKTPPSNKIRSELIAFLNQNKEALIQSRQPLRISSISDYKNIKGDLGGKEFQELDSEFEKLERAREESLRGSRRIAEIKRFFAMKEPYSFHTVAPLLHLECSTNDALALLALLENYRKEVVESMPRGKKFGAENSLGRIEKRLQEKAGIAAPVASNPAPNVQPPTLANPLPGSRSNRVAFIDPPFGTNRPPFGRFNPALGNQEDPPDVPTITSPKTINLTRYWKVPGVAAGPGISRESQFNAPLLRDGRIWFHYIDNATFSEQTGGTIYALDANSFAVKETIRLQGEQFSPSPPSFYDRFNPEGRRTFETLGPKLFVLGVDSLLQTDETRSAWRKLELPANEGLPWRVANRLYFLTPDSLFLVDETTGTTETLASVRRRPAQGPLDELATLKGAALTEGTDGALRVLFGATCFAFHNKEWTIEAKIDRSAWRASEKAAFAIGNNAADRSVPFHALFASLKVPTLIANPKSLHRGSVNRPNITNSVFSSLTVSGGIPFMDGTNVAILAGRGEGAPREVAYSERSNQMDLFFFRPAGENPIQVPMQLDLTQGEAPAERGIAFRFQPWILVTERHLLIGHTRIHGFWIVPLSDIHDAIQAATGAAEGSK